MTDSSEGNVRPFDRLVALVEIVGRRVMLHTDLSDLNGHRLAAIESAVFAEGAGAARLEAFRKLALQRAEAGGAALAFRVTEAGEIEVLNRSAGGPR